jgi:hypothetical protein
MMHQRQLDIAPATTLLLYYEYYYYYYSRVTPVRVRTLVIYYTPRALQHYCRAHYSSTALLYVSYSITAMHYSIAVHYRITT